MGILLGPKYILYNYMDPLGQSAQTPNVRGQEFQGPFQPERVQGSGRSWCIFNERVSLATPAGTTYSVTHRPDLYPMGVLLV